MSKKVLILTTSPRRNSNSDALAEAFARGAAESGCEVELISLRGKELRFCQGCFACQKSGKCVIRDDMQEIVPKMEQADVLAFATPIYYYEMSGQMKTLLDRGNPLFVADYCFRDVYFFASAAEDAAETASACEEAAAGSAPIVRTVITAASITAIHRFFIRNPSLYCFFSSV